MNCRLITLLTLWVLNFLVWGKSGTSSEMWPPFKMGPEQYTLNADEVLFDELDLHYHGNFPGFQKLENFMQRVHTLNARQSQ